MMGYRKSFVIFLCVTVIFIFSLKFFFLDKYFEDMDIKAYSIHSANQMKKGAQYLFSKLSNDVNNMYMYETQKLPYCDLPNDLGPYSIKIHDSFDNTSALAFQYANFALGGHNKPDNCTALQKIAIVIPFRNREQHLQIWLYNMHPFLQRQQADYGIYVVEQYGNSKFNRAKLMNIGYKEAVKEYNYSCFIFSDVDIIPMDQRNLYRCSKNPKHMAHSLDKFQFRVVAAGMQIERAANNISKAKAVLHHRDIGNERNPKSVPLIKKASERMHIDGLSSLNYTVISITKHRLYTKVTVDVGLPEKDIY
ncbi:beta-1,4-galactosyltransferase 1-like isoform X4 [Dendropsophus ebraccatus]|uniref:beta-1,4-galactosyltransferase 1-like isoform X4 n=1 Tax=Dendropsophus ebraccatus TaxID=150705 RepID=UPI003831B7CD